jgi:hypothetical protein
LLQNGSFQRICEKKYYVKEKVEVWKGNTKIVVKVKIMMKVKLMCPFHIQDTSRLLWEAIEVVKLGS